MGSFRGHALPGSFFIIMGIWWSIKVILKHIYKKHKWTSYLDSKALFQRIEISEGILVIIMGFTGMLGEQFSSEGPHMTLYSYEKGHWVQLLSWHHFTMYLFFTLLGVTNILCAIISSLPSSLSKLMLSNAFLVEGFIFYNHTHGREMLDIFLHQILVLVIFLTALIAFIEFVVWFNTILELFRSSLIILQGSWFWQIGFVLYPPSGSPPWDSVNHDNIMFLTVCFCWHYAFILVFTGVGFVFITWLVRTRLKKFFPSEVELLKNVEQQEESEEEM